VDGSASDDDARACHEHFEVLAQRSWSWPLSFIDQVDELAVTSQDDLPVLRTVGIVVALPDTDERSNSSWNIAKRPSDFSTAESVTLA